MNRVQDLAHWINERERIRVRKELLDRPAPWTDDPVLQNYRFCNVRREDDKVTRWVRVNWSEKYGGQHPNILLAMTLARFVNRISSLHRLKFPHSGVDKQLFRTLSDTLKPFWGNAYTISTCGAAMPKSEYALSVLDHIARIQEPFHALCVKQQSMAEAHNFLSSMYGLGDFLSAQILADLKHTRGHPLETARDRLTWAAPGPGSRRGLDRYDGARKGGPGGWLARLHRVEREVQPWIENNLWDDNLYLMDMQDWQNCMCEFDKYLRIKEDKGHVRNKYPGTGR